MKPMKHPVFALLGLLAVVAAPVAHAVEILRWERMPLAVPLKVGQERIVFIDRNVRVGVPAGVGERLRVQSAGGAIYLRANEPIEPTRLQLQDADTGALILLDIAAEPPNAPTCAVTSSRRPARASRPRGCSPTCSSAWTASADVAVAMPICRWGWAYVTATRPAWKAVCAGWSPTTRNKATGAAGRMAA